MFDVGFSELMVVAVVALVVIGPERLPAVARTLGHLFGRLQRYVNDVKADISREIELEELKKFKSQFEDAAQSVESGIRTEVEGAQTSLGTIASEMNVVEGALTDAQAAAGAPGAADVADSSAAAPAGPDAGGWHDAGTAPAVPAADAGQKTAA